MSNITISEINSSAQNIQEGDLLLVSKYDQDNQTYQSAKINASLFQRFVKQETINFNELTVYSDNDESSQPNNNLNFPAKNKQITNVEGMGLVIEDFNGSYTRSTETWANTDSVIVPIDCYVVAFTSGIFGSKNNISSEDRDTENLYGRMNVAFSISTNNTDSFFDVSYLSNDWCKNTSAIIPLKKGNKFRFEFHVSSYYSNLLQISTTKPIKVPFFRYSYRLIPVL